MDKPLPNNREAEIALIADIFIKNDIITDTIGLLKASDFYYKPHEIIYSKLIDLYKKNIPIDILTFTNSIDKKLLQSIGGITYLSQIIGTGISTANYKAHMKIIKDLSIKRDLITACEIALQNAYNEESQPKGIIDILESKLLNTIDIDDHKTINMSQLMEETVNIIEKGFKDGGKLTGITTGYKPIDNATNGFIKGDLMVIAARPSMGKTSLIINMINRLPKDNKAALFELEMSQEKIGFRMLAIRTLLDSQKLARGQIKDTDFTLIMKKASEISYKDNIYINCKAGLNVTEIKAEAKKIKIQHGLDIIFIDHIGKIRPDNIKASRNDQIGQISEGLKNIAKDLNICVVVLSQLNRAVEARTDKHPTMSDLRDSGNIEQDADEILLLYRDDYYAERENRDSKSPGTLEIFAAKNRDGEIGLIKLIYNTKYQIITEQSIFH
jgi:replicative DNA helicase